MEIPVSCTERTTTCSSNHFNAKITDDQPFNTTQEPLTTDTHSDPPNQTATSDDEAVEHDLVMQTAALRFQLALSDDIIREAESDLQKDQEHQEQQREQEQQIQQEQERQFAQPEEQEQHEQQVQQRTSTCAEAASQDTGETEDNGKRSQAEITEAIPWNAGDDRRCSQAQSGTIKWLAMLRQNQQMQKGQLLQLRTTGQISL